MIVAPSHPWKLALAVVLLLGAIACGVFARAPSAPIERGELRRLMAAAFALYGVGLLASRTHHAELAGLVYASGIVVSSLAMWLSRGGDPEDPPDEGEEPVDDVPPPRPDGEPMFDWDEFERAMRAYEQERRIPA